MPKAVIEEHGTPLFRASVVLVDDLYDIADRVREAFAEAFTEKRSREKGEQEYTLEQTQAFQEYVASCEELLEGFLEREQVSRQAFFDECRDSLQGQFCALFEQDINVWFVNMILAIDDFEEFYELMTSQLYNDAGKRSGGEEKGKK